MKFIILLIAFISVNNGCSASKTNQDTISIEYKAVSRSTFKHIIINKKSVSKAGKIKGANIKKTLSETDWNRLMQHLKNVTIENISELKAPSKAFQFDGAALARIKVTVADKTYESAPFDHGNPPKEIAELVKEILSISENIE